VNFYFFINHYEGVKSMLRVKFEWDYGLPDYDPEIHDPDRVFRFLTYRGVSYAKWVFLKSRGIQNWKVTK